MKSNWKGLEPMKDLTGYLEQDQINILLDHAVNPSHHLIILLLSRTGRRVSEIIRGSDGMGIRVKDIDFENKVIHMITLKRKKEKELDRDDRTTDIVPVDDGTLGFLKDYISYKDLTRDDFLFPITRQGVFSFLRSIGKKAGIEYVGKKRIHPHHLRHSFAVYGARTIENPAGLRLIQETMGHSDISITSKYLKFNPIERRKLINKMWDKDES